MSFEDVLSRYFDKVYTEVDFIKRTYYALKNLGFTDDNTIASACVCRDEIAQSIRSLIKHMWGEAFNLSSLAGMFFAGRTGLLAAMHHAPNVEGRERYVFYALPHIAIDEEGKIGVCKRTGREGESIACGALSAFQKELKNPPTPPLSKGGKGGFEIDTDDIEMSLIRMRLIKEIPYGHVPDLLELTKITQKVIQTDIEHVIKGVIDTKKSDYAVITGIQIHGPDGNYMSPSLGYAVVNNEKIQLNV